MCSLFDEGMLPSEAAWYELEVVESEGRSRLTAAAVWLSVRHASGAPVLVEAEIAFDYATGDVVAVRARATADAAAQQGASPEGARLPPLEVERALAGAGIPCGGEGAAWRLHATGSSRGHPAEYTLWLAALIDRRVRELQARGRV